jgi:hypothetical protein
MAKQYTENRNNLRRNEDAAGKQHPHFLKSLLLKGECVKMWGVEYEKERVVYVV